MSDFIKIKPIEWETGWHFGLDLWVAEGYEISFSKEQGWYLKGHGFKAMVWVKQAGLRTSFRHRYGDNPARAWLIAIIKALISIEEVNSGHA